MFYYYIYISIFIAIFFCKFFIFHLRICVAVVVAAVYVLVVFTNESHSNSIVSHHVCINMWFFSFFNLKFPCMSFCDLLVCVCLVIIFHHFTHHFNHLNSIWDIFYLCIVFSCLTYILFIKYVRFMFLHLFVYSPLIQLSLLLLSHWNSWIL